MMLEVVHPMENRKGELLVVLGTVLLFVGPMLNFIDLEGPGGSLSGSGYDIDEGSTYVLAGIVALVGLAMAWLLKGGGRKAGGVIMLIAGLFGAYGGFVDAFTTPDGIPESVDISHGIGAYIVFAAGIIVAIGAIMVLKSDAEEPVAPPPAAPPPTAPPPTT